MKKSQIHKPPDWKERELILRELDRNLIVEAAAGTGKTTALVGRMINLLINKKCEIRNIVAITFTKKAASELRTRFRIELEKKCLTSRDTYLHNALENLETCFIGTIHSFCARLLRERPVEADVDIPFEEMEPEDDLLMRQQVWQQAVSALAVDDRDNTIAQFESLGIGIPDLMEGFLTYTDFPDVTHWPGSEVTLDLPQLHPVLEEIKKYAQHMEHLRPRLPLSWKNDTLIPFYREFPRVCAAFHRNSPLEMYSLLKLFDRNLKIVQKEWTVDNQFTKEDAKEEKARWDHFREQVIIPVLHEWHVCRYGPVMRLFNSIQKLYDEQRKEGGKLNFSDLLMKAAELLKTNPLVRRYFQQKYTHLLIDEFQDTDPVQAEVMMFLTATDPDQQDFRRCIPIPGSLFVVGDPKQSIYRFRRADIVTYNEVKRIICNSGGVDEKGILVRLSGNFRCTRPIREWVNTAFEEQFPPGETPQSPVYVPLQQGRPESVADKQGNVYQLTIGADYCNTTSLAVEYEAERIAGFIHHLLEKKAPDGSGMYRPSDIMIITRKRKHLSMYADGLNRHHIPYGITGGTTLNDIRELKLLYLCLKAILNPDDPVALTGILRSELFGFSDVKLYVYHQAGGTFSFLDPIPEGLKPRVRDFFKHAFHTLKQFRYYFNRMPAVAACEKIIADLGLMCLAGLHESGHIHAGGLAKCVELVRSLRSELWSPVDIVNYLKILIDQVITYDGISVSQEDNDVVRIMNLHQSKGLEARVVFLADPSGSTAGMGMFDPTTHILRSENVTRGYMIVQNRKGYQVSPLAFPGDWDAYEKKEAEFLLHEDIRLQYVAATRAKEILVISRKEKNNSRNFWKCFEHVLESAPELPDPGPLALPVYEQKRISVQEMSTAHQKIKNNILHSMEKTYLVKGAKEWALRKSCRGYDMPELSGKSGDPVVHLPHDMPGEGIVTEINESGEHGVEWGELIHKLLEAKMKDKKLDITTLCTALLPDYDFDSTSVPGAVSLVESVLESDIWKRACAAKKVYTEIPFQVCTDKEYGFSPSGIPGDVLPVIIRGVIDLVFLDAHGWVIVDYKTDTVKTPQDLNRLHGYYTPQLSLYAHSWAKATGEKVVEAGMFFVTVNTYYQIKI